MNLTKHETDISMGGNGTAVTRRAAVAVAIALYGATAVATALALAPAPSARSQTAAIAASDEFDAPSGLADTDETWFVYDDEAVRYRYDEPDVSADGMTWVTTTPLRADGTVAYATGLHVTGTSDTWIRAADDSGTFYLLASHARRGTHVDIVDGDAVGQVWRDRADRVLYSVPQNVIDRFAAEGWRLELVANPFESPDTRPGHEGQTLMCAGSCSPSDQRIYVVASDRAVNDAELHELGHYVGMVTGGDAADEFIADYEAEHGMFEDSNPHKDGYETSTPAEYFANVFKMYVKNPSKCEKMVPKSCEYVRRCIQEV